jgi:hypothetical protein
VTRNTLLVDFGIAALLAILVLILAPGLAAVAIIALFVMVVCAVSLVLDLRRGGSRRAGRRYATSRPERPRRVR